MGEVASFKLKTDSRFSGVNWTDILGAWLHSWKQFAVSEAMSVRLVPLWWSGA